MSNNLNELNTVLFETLRGLKAGTTPAKDAQAITNVSNSIINSAKLQLSAAKFVKGGSIDTDFFGELKLQQNTNGLIGRSDLYDLKLEFALSMGYENLAAAISDLGKNEFTSKFKQSQKDE